MSQTATDETSLDGKSRERRARRPRPLPGMARKVAELAAEIEQIARLEHERDTKDHGRVRALLNTATGGGAEKLLRDSVVLNDEDKEFLREHGWRA